MITTIEAIYRFKLEYDKLDSQDYPKLEIPQILIILNKAQNRIVKNAFSPNNLMRQGAETSQLRKDQLSALTISNNPYVSTIVQGIEPNQYYINQSSLAYPYLHYLTGYCLAERGSCKNISLTFKEYTWNDRNEVLASDNTKPSFDWQEVPIFIGDKRFYMYTDGTFNITAVKINYLKLPVQFDLEGYIKFDGSPSQTVNSDLPDFMIEDIITEAVAIAKGITETEGYQIQRQESNTNIV